MAVNTLVTGMMVFRFLKVMGFKPTSVEQTLGSAGVNKFRHIMFIIIESGMALFAIQMVRVVLVFVPVSADQLPFLQAAIDFVIVINQMLNVIIITINFCFSDYIYLGNRTNNNFGAGSNEVVLR